MSQEPSADRLDDITIFTTDRILALIAGLTQ